MLILQHVYIVTSDYRANNRNYPPFIPVPVQTPEPEPEPTHTDR